MHDKADKIIDIYTDGACSGNPGPGGWGAVLSYGDTSKEIYGSDIMTTNNKMELKAAIEALKLLKRHCTVNLYTDSNYLKDGITKWIFQWKKNGWRSSSKEPVKNIELWHELDAEIQKHHINWHWVKGHSDNQGNIKADLLACKGRDEAKIKLASEA